MKLGMSASQIPPSTLSYRKKFLQSLLAPFLIIVALAAGIGIGRAMGVKNSTPLRTTSSPLRLGGYDLISPLLLCDTTQNIDSPELSALQKNIQNSIDTNTKNGNITTASVYFRDLQSTSQFTINNDERFFPASLKKLPLMMQYYKEAESNPSLLTESKVLTGTTDDNAGTIIPPKEAPQYGQSYTAEQLIEYMIKYSDNISFQVLYPGLGEDKFDQIYKEMQIEYPNSFTSTGDYASVFQFSLFFRTLYGATYLNNDDSEKALQLLGQTDFKDGLVAGVPSDLTVAHKFGVSAVNQPDGSQQGELHDCGIIYDKKHPYLLCVMTKSKATDITRVEKTLARISEIAYQSAEANYR